MLASAAEPSGHVFVSGYTAPEGGGVIIILLSNLLLLVASLQFVNRIYLDRPHTSDNG